MVGTRSKNPAQSINQGDEASAELEIMGEDEQRSPQRPGRSRAPLPLGGTSLERLPRPSTARSHRSGSTDDGVNTLTQDKTRASRSSLRSASQQTGRVSTRTSLESLPPPPAPAAATPPRRRSRILENKDHAGSTNRLNAELNALLGLDAANQRAGWPCRAESSSEGEEEEEEVEEVEEEAEARQRKRLRPPGGSSRREGSRGTKSGGSRTGGNGNGGAGGGGSGRVRSNAGGGSPPKYGFRDRTTLKRTDFFTYDRHDGGSEEEEEGDEEEEEMEESEEGEEDEMGEEDEGEGAGRPAPTRPTGANRKQRRYKLRKREVTRRQVFNVTAEEPLPRKATRKDMPYDMSASSRVSIRKRKRSSAGGSSVNGAASGGSRRHRRRHDVRRSHFDSSSESSDDGGGFADHDRGFARYQRKTHERELGSIQPINTFGAGGAGAGGGQGSMLDKTSARDLLRADASPMEIDSSITFDSIGGGKKHVRMLKEMVMLPLVYPELFDGFGAQPPKGVLFYGPPGTGKTLTARALANACSKSGHRISFFMRKGADCLSKWVGEAERQLRLLFEQARRHQPSIIFFDEIDGLAPVRSVKQDQIHASVVSTLLALMDGLDSRGQVIVIGATNRPDSLDPALRRPGRFDRELAFPLPSRRARREILRVHTRDWKPPLDPSLEDELAERTAGFCGADMKALCAEATLLAVRRRYPQIYASDEKLLLDAKSLKVTRSHFMAALRGITPSSQREGINSARPLPEHLTPLLSDSLAAMLETLRVQFPHVTQGVKSLDGASDDEMDADDWSEDEGGYGEDEGDGKDKDKDKEDDEEKTGGGGGLPCDLPIGRVARVGMPEIGSAGGGYGMEGMSVGGTWIHRPRLTLYGLPGCGQRQLAAAALHALDGVPIHSLALHSLHGDPSRTAESSLVSRFVEARRNVPSVLYLPDAHQWWDGDDSAVHPHLRTLLVNLLQDIPDSWPILVVSTWETRAEDGGASACGASGAAVDFGGGHNGGDMGGIHRAQRRRSLAGSLPPGSRASRQLVDALLGSREHQGWARQQLDGVGADQGSLLSLGRWSKGMKDARHGDGASGGGGGGRDHDRACGRGRGVDVGPAVERGQWSGALEMKFSGEAERKGFLEEVLNTVSSTIRKAFSGRRPGRGGPGTGRRGKRPPPPPLPLAPRPVRQEESEDEALSKEDEHHLRELRICLREVLSEVRKQRRFAMFREIGDYEGEYMDLNTMREKLNSEEYETVEDFEVDLNLMADEAKELRDRHKADLAALEAAAAATEGAVAKASLTSSVVSSIAPGPSSAVISASTPATRGVAKSGSSPPATGGESVMAPTAPVGGAGVAGTVSGGVSAVAEGGADAARRAAAAAGLAADRKRVQLERASHALDLAFLLRDTALSFLQNCMNRMGYDLEATCKDIAQRRKAGGARGSRDGVASAAGSGTGSISARCPSAANSLGKNAGPPNGRASPNYTSESVIVDIYGGAGACGSVARERSTRASRRTASSDGKLLQLGDNGKLLVQGTEMELEVEQPRKRSNRQQQRELAAKRGHLRSHEDGKELEEQPEDVADEKDVPSDVAGATVADDGVDQAAVALLPVASFSHPGDGVETNSGFYAGVGSSHNSPVGSPLASAALVGSAENGPAPFPPDEMDAESRLAPGASPVANGHCDVDLGVDKEVDESLASTAEVSLPAGGGEASEEILSTTTKVADANDNPASGDQGEDDFARMDIVQEDQIHDGESVGNDRGSLPSSMETDVLPSPCPTDAVARQVFVHRSGLVAPVSTVSEALGENEPPRDGLAMQDSGSRSPEPMEPEEASTLPPPSSPGGTKRLPVEIQAKEVVEADATVPMSVKTRSKAEEEEKERERKQKEAEEREEEERLEQARRECSEACARLFDIRERLVSETRGWSVDQLVALRGSMLELAAGVCARAIPSSRARSAGEAVDRILVHTDICLS